MSKRKKVFSGVFVISILVKHFGFLFVAQRGSHVKLRAGGKGGRTTIVPLHKELAPGTIKGILALAGVEKEEFMQKIEKT